MKFKETSFGEVIINIKDAKHYLVEVIRESPDEYNERCEEFCSLQEICHQTTGPRRFCRCFDADNATEFCFVTEDLLER